MTRSEVPAAVGHAWPDPHAAPMPQDYIARALADTVTSHGGAFYDEYLTCQQRFRLMHVDLVEPSALGKPKYLDVGSLVHAVLRYAGECIMRGESAAGWEAVLDAAVQAPYGYPEDAAEEARRIMHHYWLRYDIAYAGYPPEARLISIEDEWRHDFGGLPVSARADVMLEMHDELFIVDHKTRSSKFPDAYVRDSATRPQFLRLAALYRAKCNVIPAIWVNGLIKTAIPKFERHVIRFDAAQVDAWCENQVLLASAIRRQDWAQATMNFSQCSDGTFGACSYRDFCHGSEELEALKFRKKDDKSGSDVLG